MCTLELLKQNQYISIDHPQQACLKVQGGKIAFYGIAKQETAECVLSKNGDCALKYTGKAFNRFVEFLVIAIRDKS